MEKILEIRWHGRGGQGAKTAALLFADAAMSSGQYIQGFPDYGPERMGAPVQAFNRLSNRPITIHCGITNPDIVVVLDPTLTAKVNVTSGLPKGGKLIINTSKSSEEIKKELGAKDIEVYAIDASKISKETIGRDIPNTPMLGALVKVSGIMKIDDMLADTKQKLEKKFASKPEIVKGNLLAIKKAFDEVRS